ncbi:DUF2062 domain-containing protein [Flammeovirga sp. MY04]|uniref:DUF2062 domain-containing protein n=1 Tax=Flammeovirga sp. MY04 TaxID=1191459 RepID=UPI000826CB5C|nr:DUF2062 domain-containing protein [Flammeovirga sp. MY04]ANQ50425.2 DUF2062 domain-containing protein [Flammeovirga sp. MY04]
MDHFLKRIRLSIKHHITHRILIPLRTLLRQGMTPHLLAWSVTVGLLIGSSPLLGICTWLCILAASIFRLNQFAIQIANYAVSPIQVFMIIPYIKAGTSLFGNSAKGVTLEKIQEALDIGIIHGIKEMGILMLQGAAVWIVVSAIIALPMQRLLRIAFRKMLKNMNSSEEKRVTE